MATANLTDVLETAGVQYELLPHAHTETATSEAQALGISSTEVAKTLIVRTPDRYVRAVLQAPDRIDLHKLAGLYGETRKHVELVSEEDLAREYPEFELGAVPPFGGAHDDGVVVDRRLAERESVALEAGTHHESIRLATADLLQLTKARVADICEDE
jgi:Ala-tRNA(Pro) deacylase